MPVMYNTGDWFSLRPHTYRKFDLYSFNWPMDVNLDYMRVYAAPFGGPIAVIRDFSQIAPVKGNAKIEIKTFDSSGTLLGTILWNHGRFITMGWSDTEDLICVQDDGLVITYSMFGEEKHTFSMSPEASRTKVTDARIFSSSSGTGIAVLTTSGRVFLKSSNIGEFKTRQMPDIPKSSSENISCWQIVSEDRNSYCLIGREKEIIKLVPGQSVGLTHRNLFDKPFDRIVQMSVSYNHQFLALYTNNGLLWLGTVDMKKKFCEFDTGRLDQPKQIEWIMDSDNTHLSDAVTISYPSLLLVVNKNGDQNIFTYDPAIFLVPELDGVRIITNSTHEMIQKVPKCVQNIFAINSQEPSSFLFEAQKKFQERSHQSDEYLSLFRGKMDVAVDECIEAAGYEFCPETQKSLITTAYFGKGFIALHNPDKYMRICRILRVLNALRHPKIAIPLTYKQFCHLKPDVILSRLVFRKNYAVAIQVAKHLKLPESWILEHWAIHKVYNDRDDNEVARKITEKFKNPSVQGISYCNIAEKAHDIGKDDLAIKLLELEPRSSLQVPLLLKLGKFDKALFSATQSGDTDLVQMVLLKIKENMTVTNFHMIIRDFPMAFNLYRKAMAECSRTALTDSFHTEDDHQSIAEYTLRYALKDGNVESNLLIIANRYSQGKRIVEADLCTETGKILKLQKALNQKLRSTGVELCSETIHDTVLKLLRLGELKEAEKIKNDYKIPERRYWWMRVQTLAEKGKFEELEKLSKSKKSPIGYEPFVEVCLSMGNVHEARKYIARCREDKKAKWYIRAGLHEDAAGTAFEQRDINTLQSIMLVAANSGNRTLSEKVDAFIQHLRKTNKH
ncbi:vacuolar protein sorting-associated protein 16 homolog isoform X1 [Episyrphus balteatus]|uniref:vacuolar protein sorting-associated protein 16 homolog isoform X1 n=1 Tax=Episyrphus balteatus TaxID=286459 RepID=UPI0024868F56|nr:vacuolar protein sorting-associated protein 16 homolog isoform X1 [Episyrphus balteatus]